MLRKFLTVFYALCVMLMCGASAFAQAFETRAGQAMLYDVNTGTILFSKDADKQIPPASLAKLMTMEVVFNALKSGQLTLDDTFIVSENAWRNGGASSGGSTMFAELNSEIRVEDLIRGVIIQSANDGCLVLAEGMAGTESAFVDRMNHRARAIGLKNSVFYNSTGLPHPDQKVTIRDLVTLANHIRSEYPDYYRYYSETEFTWNKILQRNRNPLLAMDIGADGMKTGFTDESGYAIVGSTLNEGRRLVVAMSGLENERDRAQEARKLLEWGRRSFQSMRLFEAGDEIGSVRLYGGAELTAPVRVDKELIILVPLGNQDRMKAEIVYQGPIAAPVEEGAQIAELHISIGDELAQVVPVYAVRSIGKGPIHRQALDAVTEYLLSLI